MAKNITLEMLLARKQQSNDGKMKIVLFNSKVLGGTIEIVKQKARDVMKIMDDMEEKTMTASTKANCKLILKHCPIFREKELQVAYDVAEPHEVVLRVFDDNIGEVGKLTEKILAIYGLADEDKKKNLLEEEVEEIKN
ncbi:phage portal protein [Fusobacterium necrophorum subsp. funduliforme]|uniref:phage portal protein n=1 Tax=Fusobacterium necrophorum TaxID=859 RepID=UPI0007868A2B|nr:phage portal protein [Fusobacterium necrophorum]KYM52135.1 phage portal protein [Fusobacterium necrophorum subsp. funduliforme]